MKYGCIFLSFWFGELINSYVFFNEEKTREVSNKDVLIRTEVSRSYWRAGRRTESDEIGHVTKRRYGECGIDWKDGGEEKQRKDESNSRQQHQQRTVAVPTPCDMAPR